MNKFNIALAVAVFYCSPAIASVDPISDFFEEVFQQPAATQSYSAKGPRGSHRIHIDTNTGVNQMIADHVSSRLGAEWVPTALQIARIESGGRCGAVNASGATGVFQVINPSRFGVSRSYARTCEGGIQAGVSHMAMCIQKGARTHYQMMICHNAGTPFARRVERAYRFAVK